MILTGAGAGQERIATPYRPGDNLGTAVGQLAGYFREEAIIAHHQAYLAEAGGKDRVFRTWRHSAFNLAARQADLAVFANELTVRADKHGHVVDKVAVALQKTWDNVEIMLPGQSPEVVGAGAGDWFGYFMIFLAETDVGERLAEHDQVGALTGRLSDEGLNHAAIVLGRVAARRLEVDRRQPNPARRGRLSLGKTCLAPPHLTGWRPAQVQFDHGLGRSARSLIS